MRSTDTASRLVLILGLLGWFAVTTFSLTTYPAPKADEAWFSATAYQWLTHGNFGLPLYLDMAGSTQKWAKAPLSFEIVQAAWTWLLGPGLWTSRMLSAIGGLLTTCLLQRLGSHLYGSRTGTLAALLFAFSWRAFYSTHWARPDIWVAAVGVIGLILFVWSTRGAHARWLGLGLYAGWLPTVWLTAVSMSGMLGLLAVWQQARRRRWAELLWCGIGAAIGLGLWIGVQFGPDVRQSIEQWRDVWLGGAVEGVPSLGTQFVFFWHWLKYGFWGLTRFSWVEVLFFLVALSMLLSRRSGSDRLVLRSLTGFGLSYLFLVTAKNAYHAIIVMPLVSLTIAAGGSALGQALARNFRRYPWTAVGWAFLLTGPLLGLYIAGNLRLAWVDRNVDYNTYVHQLRRYIPADASIFGEGIWWFGFPGSTFTADDIALFDPDMQFGKTAGRVAQMFAERRVEYVLVDEQLGSFYLDAPVGAPIRKAIAVHLAQNCSRIGVVSGTMYGADQGGPAVKVTNIYYCPVE